MKWLHISDLHFDPKGNIGVANELIRLLPEFLKTKNIKVDEIFITGDFCYAPTIAKLNLKQNKESAKDAVEFITKIAKAVDIDETADHIHIVPGNHDLNREYNSRIRVINAILDDYDKYAKDNQYVNDFDFSADFETLTKGFEYFNCILKGLYEPKKQKNIYAKMKKDVHYTTTILDQINILHLNTAILCGLGKDPSGRDLEDRRLIIGHQNVQKLLEELKTKNRLPTIVLAHHSIDFLTRQEVNSLKNYFKNHNIKLYLCGHAHYLGTTNVDDTEYVTNGCVDSKQNVEASFYVGSYDNNKRTGFITAYIWRKNKWESDNHFANGGRLSFDLNMPISKKTLKLRKPSSSNDFYEDDYMGENITFEDSRQNLINYMENQGKDTAVQYILSGLSNSMGFNSKITPELFYSEFYVPRTFDEESELNDKLESLFSSTIYNMLCLKGVAGTGKSTFIKTMECRHPVNNQNNNKPQFRYIILDCSRKPLNFDPHTSYQFPTLDIIKFFKNELKRLSNFYITKSNVKWRDLFKNTLEKIAYSNNNLLGSNYSDYWEHFQSNISEVIKSLNLENIQDDNIDFKYRYAENSKILNIVDELTQIVILLLILSCKNILASSENKKYVIIFDNIEAYTSDVAMSVGDNYKSINEMIKTLFENLESVNAFSIEETNLDVDFIKDFTFVFCIRPTTNFPLCSIQNVNEVFGMQEEYIYERKYYDFTPEAMLKKLKFITSNNLRCELYDEVEKLTSLLIPKSIIKKYLQDKKYTFDDDNVKHFTSKTYLPFFNNNFRNAVANLSLSYKKTTNDNRTWMEYVHKLNEQQNSELGNECVNLARMIIFKNIFDNFMSRDYFEAFGINHIDGQQKHSEIRIVLAYLYWKKASNYTKDYEGITLNEIIEFFSESYTEEKIIDVLCTLSKDTKDQHPNKNKAILEWGDLVEFVKGIKNQGDIRKSLKNGDKSKIIVSITPAGQCFVEYVSLQFEFFSSRIQDIDDEPLVLLDNRKTHNGSEEYLFESIIDKVYESILNFAIGVKNGIMGLRCVREQRCNKNHVDCQLFIRSQELYGAISENINYIDRFRLVMFKKYECTKINNILLEKIVQFHKLYDITQEWCDAYPECHTNNKGISIGKLKEDRGNRSVAKTYFVKPMSNDDFKKIIENAKEDMKSSKIAKKSIYEYVEESV